MEVVTHNCTLTASCRKDCTEKQSVLLSSNLLNALFLFPGLFFCLYRELQPKNPRRPHTTGPKPHQMKPQQPNPNQTKPQSVSLMTLVLHHWLHPILCWKATPSFCPIFDSFLVGIYRWLDSDFGVEVTFGLETKVISVWNWQSDQDIRNKYKPSPA